MKNGSLLPAVAATVCCAAASSAGLTPVRTSTIISTSASVYEDRDVGLLDNEQVSAGTPWEANLDAAVEHLSVSAFAAADSLVDWNDLTGRLTHDIDLETSLTRTGASPFHRADAYAGYLGTIGLELDARTTLTIHAEAFGDAGWSLGLYRLEPGISHIDARLGNGDILHERLTLDAGFYILSTDAYILTTASGSQSFDRFGARTAWSLWITVPAPASLLGLAPLGLFAARRRR